MITSIRLKVVRYFVIRPLTEELTENETKPCFLYFNHTRPPGKTKITTSCNISPFTVINDVTKISDLNLEIIWPRTFT